MTLLATTWLQRIETWIEKVGPNPWVQSAAILVGTLVVAKVADWMITRVIGRLARKTAGDLDDRFLKILHRPVFMCVVLLGLGLITKRLGLGKTPEGVTISVLQTIAVFVLLGFALRFTKLFLELISGFEDRFTFVQTRTLPLFSNLATIVFIGGGIYLLCRAWELDVTAWLASAGIIGLALSFAAKDSLANLFAGVFILADAPYQVGHFVVLDSGERGVVTHIGLRSTRLLTRDDVEITVPNSVMGNSKITNETGGPYEKYRIRIKVGVAYGSDIDQVERVLMDIANEHPSVCRDPAPRVRFRQFGASSLDLELLCWVAEPVLRGKAIHELNVAVYKRFLEESIEIPYAKTDIYIRETPNHIREKS